MGKKPQKKYRVDGFPRPCASPEDQKLQNTIAIQTRRRTSSGPPAALSEHSYLILEHLCHFISLGLLCWLLQEVVLYIVFHQSPQS